MEVLTTVTNVIIEYIRHMTVFTRQALLTFTIGLAVYLVIDLLGDIIAVQIIRWQVLLRSKQQTGKQKQQKASSYLYHRLVFSPTVKPEDIYGINALPWETFYIGGGAIGAMMGVFTGKTVATTAINIMVYAIFGFITVYFFRWFYTYVRKIKTGKDAMDTMDLIQNELVSQRTLTGALSSIRTTYQRHVNLYGEKSWLYQNYVLSRLVYLISTEPEFIAVNLLKRLGEELGEVDVIKRIMQNALIRIGQSGDAATVLKEQIDSYGKQYADTMRETIPEFGDKLFFPIMLTHFIPFLIIILWPIVSVVNGMMSGGVGTPTNTIFK